MGGEMKDAMGPSLWTPSYQDWCSLCDCQMVNLQTTETNAEPLIMIILEEDQLASWWSVYYMEPLLSWKGQRFVLIGIDMYSRYGFALCSCRTSSSIIIWWSYGTWVFLWTFVYNFFMKIKLCVFFSIAARGEMSGKRLNSCVLFEVWRQPNWLTRQEQQVRRTWGLLPISKAVLFTSASRSWPATFPPTITDVLTWDRDIHSCLRLTYDLSAVVP